MNGGHIVQPNGELNKLLKTIHHGMMEDNKKDKKLLYDFPLFWLLHYKMSDIIRVPTA